MRFAKLLLLLCLPAFFFNAPLHASPQPPPEKPKLSVWDLLTYENLSYDNIMSFIDTIQYGESSLYSVDEVMSFVTFLARQGIPEWNTQDQDELENDIAYLFSNEDEGPYIFSYLSDQTPNIILAINTYPQPECSYVKGG